MASTNKEEEEEPVVVVAADADADAVDADAAVLVDASEAVPADVSEPDAPVPEVQAEDTPSAKEAPDAAAAAPSEQEEQVPSKVNRFSMQDVKNALGSVKASSTRVLEKIPPMKKPQKEPDVIVDAMQDGLKELQRMVDDAKAVASDKEKSKWDCLDSLVTPLAALFDDKTLEDVYVAFCKWARVASSQGEEEENKINVSKAFARLSSYVSWMHANASHLENLTTASVKDDYEAWKFQISYDQHERLVWWIQLDEEKVQAMIQQSRDKEDDSVDRSGRFLRLVVWLVHYIMLDTRAQDHGMVLCECLGRIRFWKGIMTILPPKLSVKLDRLTVGVLPIRMKQIYLLECPVWANVMVTLMKPIVSKKMQSRIVVVVDDNKEEEEKKNTAVALEQDVGTDCIPERFSTLNGTLTKNVVYETYFTSLPMVDEHDAETAQL